MDTHRQNRPNILMIIADDLGCCDLGCYGNTRAITPNIDALAHRGILMRHHYSASPMCAPARAALLTGKHPQKTGAIDVSSIRGLNRVSHDNKTLPQLLQAQGYRTGLVGKWHNGGGSRFFHPSAYGYDEFCGFEGGGSPYFDFYLERSFNQFEHVTDRYITDRLTDEAIGFIGQCAGQPFHLQLAYNAPHRPLEAPVEDIARFARYDDMTPGLKTLYAMVTRMDANIGRLVSFLEENLLLENTIILFLSDNGPDAVGTGDFAIDNRPFHYFNGYKGDVLEGGIRVPAIFSWPKRITVSGRCDFPSIFMDWFPTLASLAGVDLGCIDNVDGRNILPALSGRELPDATFFWQWTRYEIIDRSNIAMYHNGYKLYYPVFGDTTKFNAPDSRYIGMRGVYSILREPVCRESPSESIHPQLFYLPDDPEEQHNLAATHPAQVQWMQVQMDIWLTEAKEWCRKSQQDTLIDYGE